MFRNLSIGKKIHLPIIFMMFLGLLVVTINGLSSLQKITKESYVAYAHNMQGYMNQGLREKSQIGLTNVIGIANNNFIIEALTRNNRAIASSSLDKITNSFKKNSDYKNIKIHIHDANTNSFLRHWNKTKYGDDLSSFRYSLLDIKKNKKPFVTIESGRAGMLLRGIAPIIQNGAYIGSVEFIQDFDSLVINAKKEKNFDMVFLACNTEENINRFNKNTPKVNKLFLSQSKSITNQELLYELKDFEPKKLFTADNNSIIRGKFFITSVPLLNHKNEKVGCGIIATDLKKVTNFINDAKSSLLEQIYIITIIDFILLLFLLYVLKQFIQAPIDEMMRSFESIDESLSNLDFRDIYFYNRLNVDSTDEFGATKKMVNKLLLHMEKAFLNLQRTEKYSQEYIKAINAGSIVSKSDLKGNITYVNDALCKTTGYKREELLGKPHNIMRHPNTSRSTFTELWETIQSGEIYHGLFKNKKKDGTSFYANITVIPIKNEDNSIVEYVALRDDVTELVNSKKELKMTFLTDPLTSLGNRFKMIEDIEKRYKIFLAIIDIHYFKEVNDFYGHEMGDEVILDLASRLFNYFKIKGFEVYHLHGDEFAILAEARYTSKSEFYNLVQNFIEENKKYSFVTKDNQITTRLTCGISYSDNNSVNEADIAHIKAKKVNKELVEYSEDINVDEEYKKNLEWTNEIKNAINENRIKAFYQPIVNTKTDKIEKYETLMRLIKTDGEEVSPFFFLHIAKKTRLYKELTKIVVTQAFEKFSGTEYEFSINLSAEDIIMHDISDWLFELARKYKVSSQVVIEIVESEGIESFDMVDTFIQSTKENGMKIAIDDFGTGYSNFEYLIKLNTDFLKIDGSLIKEIDKDEKIYGVVETIVEFAKKNNIKVIGEFIATEPLYEKIKELDIDFGQGFFLGKPSIELQ